MWNVIRKEIQYHVSVQVFTKNRDDFLPLTIDNEAVSLIAAIPSYLSLHLLSPSSASVLEPSSSEAAPCEPSQSQRNSPLLHPFCWLLCWGLTASNGLFSGLLDLRSMWRLLWGPGLDSETKVFQVLGSGGSPDYLQELRQ